MLAAQKLKFDLFIHDMNGQTKGRIFDQLAGEVASACGSDAHSLQELFQAHFQNRDHAMSDGVAIFDVKSPLIRKAALVMCRFAHDVDFDAPDGQPINIMAAVISPYAMGPIHLQRVAAVSRLMRCDDLRDALRNARSSDEMGVLFMPSQEWMLAAA